MLFTNNRAKGFVFWRQGDTKAPNRREWAGWWLHEKGRKAVSGTANIFKLFKNLLKGPFIADVPLELLECEYGCRVGRCNHGKWLNCENRIRRMNEEIAFLQSEAGHDSAANPGRPEEKR